MFLFIKVLLEKKEKINTQVFNGEGRKSINHAPGML